MATTNITNIGRSQTFSDIKPTVTAENVSKGSAIATNIALGLIISATTIASTATVSDLAPTTSGVISVSYPQVVRPTDFLPFRLTITNIGIEGYRPNNPPGIGVQIIEFSNYIL
jgi:hypothetical protein